MSHDRTERKGTQVVHVRDGSDQAFDELFKVVINPPDEQKNTPTLPFRMRNLPASFFKQPDAKNVEGEVPGYPTQANGGMSIAHSRAHSSPATLQQTLSAAPPLPPQHIRQHSYDLVADEPLPPGWDIAKTSHGQSHLSQTTTWQDPRKSVSTTNLNKQQQQQQQQGGPPGSQSPGSPSQSQQALDNTPLPQGWERAYTAEGEVYYINHINRTTSWFHPNIPPHLQRPGMRLQQQMVGGQPQRPPQLGQRPLTPEEQQRQMKLQHLQREKERLQQRQEEIARQELLIRNLGPNADPNAAAAVAAAAAQQQTQSQSHKIGQSNEMTSIADPFLGQTATSDLHSRQESGDSGLGGMGTNYSLPKTEDFLGVDEMDTQDGGHKLPCQGDFGMDMTPMGSGEGDAANMDSDDLVPSIQDDISNQLLRDVENVLNSNKDNLLTWL